MVVLSTCCLLLDVPRQTSFTRCDLIPEQTGNRWHTQVIKVDQELGAIVVHGSVPGKPGNVLEITPAKVRPSVLL